MTVPNFMSKSIFLSGFTQGVALCTPFSPRGMIRQKYPAQIGLNPQKHPPEVFYKKGVIQNLARFKWKNLCQIFFFFFVGLRPATLLKKRLWHRCFPVNVAKFLRAPFLQNSSGRLLLWKEGDHSPPLSKSSGKFIENICSVIQFK